ncbi:MAG: DUF4330 family protein [Clostridia bacterium]|nr:DUF4330 family protein [Clostridia bacterium]
MSNYKKGKFNIIDFLIIILLAVIVIFAGYKLISGREAPKTTQLLQVKYYYNDVPEFAAKKIKAGDNVMDFLSDNQLGTVTKVEIDDAVIYGENSKGETVTSSKEGYKSVTVTTEVEANLSNHGFEVKKAMYPVGHYLSILCGDVKLYAEITEIKPL